MSGEQTRGPRGQPKPQFRLPRRLAGWALLALAALGTVIALYYAEENWRGRRAWRVYRDELIARGQSFDPTTFNPAPVPDDQNFLKAPVVESWFSPGQPAPGAFSTVPIIRITRPGDVERIGSWSEGRPTDLKEWRHLFRRRQREALASVERGASIPADTNEVVPLIVIEDVPFGDAITNLSRHLGRQCLFDPRVGSLVDSSAPQPPPTVSVWFENVSARDALEAILSNYGLRLVEPAGSKTILITRALASPPAWPDGTVDVATARLPPAADKIIPWVVMDRAPVVNVATQVVRLNGLNFQIDPSVPATASQNCYSLTLSNVSGRDLLARVLADNGLALIGPHGSAGLYRLTLTRRPPGLAPDDSAHAVLKSFEPFSREFQALYAACTRPRCRADLDYRAISRTGPRVPNFVGYRLVAQALTLRASAELALGRTDDALRDLTALWRVSDSLRGRADPVSATMRVVLSQLYLQVVWEGLASQQWGRAQIKTLDDQLRSFDLLADCRNGWEGEQACLSAWLEETPRADLAGPLAESFAVVTGAGPAQPLRRKLAEWSIRSCPRGWLDQQLLACTRVTQAQLALCDVKSQRVYPEKEAALLALTGTRPWYLVPGRVLSRALAPHCVRLVPCAARAQTAVNLARVACALEACRLHCGRFPGRLADVTPRFLDKLPHDLVNGRSLQYHLTERGRFLLYSVGWDGQDDMGRLTPASFEEGTDWAWQYPR